MRVSAALLLVVSLYAKPAFSCCASPSAELDTRVHTATMIFIGEVISIKKIGNDPYKRVASVKVNRPLKGADGLKVADVHFNIDSDITTQQVPQHLRDFSAWSCALIDKDVVKLRTASEKKEEWVFFLEKKGDVYFTSGYWGTEIVHGEQTWTMKKLQKYFPDRLAGI